VATKDDPNVVWIETARLDQRHSRVVEQELGLGVAEDLRPAVSALVLRQRRLRKGQGQRERHHEEPRQPGQRLGHRGGNPIIGLNAR
jgi:hypothetical protein